MVQEPEAADWLCGVGEAELAKPPWLGAEVALAPPRLQARDEMTRAERTAPTHPDLQVMPLFMPLPAPRGQT